MHTVLATYDLSRLGSRIRRILDSLQLRPCQFTVRSCVVLPDRPRTVVVYACENVLCSSSTEHAVFTVENLADHFPKYFLFQPLDGARSHALVARGPARAGLSRYEFCRSWRQAAALVVLNGMPSGQHCRRTTAGAAPRGRCFESHRQVGGGGK